MQAIKKFCILCFESRRRPRQRAALLHVAPCADTNAFYVPVHVSSCPAVVAGWLREQCSRMDANDLIVPVSDLRAWNACSALSLSPMSNIFHSLPNAVFLVQSSSPIFFCGACFFSNSTFLSSHVRSQYFCGVMPLALGASATHHAPQILNLQATVVFSWSGRFFSPTCADSM